MTNKQASKVKCEREEKGCSLPKRCECGKERTVGAGNEIVAGKKCQYFDIADKKDCSIFYDGRRSGARELTENPTFREPG